MGYERGIDDPMGQFEKENFLKNKIRPEIRPGRTSMDVEGPEGVKVGGLDSLPQPGTATSAPGPGSSLEEEELKAQTNYMAPGFSQLEQGKGRGWRDRMQAWGQGAFNAVAPDEMKNAVAGVGDTFTAQARRDAEIKRKARETREKKQGGVDLTKTRKLQQHMAPYGSPLDRKF